MQTIIFATGMAGMYLTRVGVKNMRAYDAIVEYAAVTATYIAIQYVMRFSCL